MATGDIYRLQQFWQVGSELTENVIHFRETTSETDANKEAFNLIFSWRDKVAPLYATDLFSDEAQCAVMTARRISPTPGVPYTIVFGGAEAGIIVGGCDAGRVPSQAAVVYGLYSTHEGPSGRGRNFWPGVCIEAQEDGRLTVDAMALAQALEALYTEEIGPNAPGTGVWKGTIWSQKDTASYPIVSAQARSNLGTIRSRRAFPGLVP
jgi:hypothetical protein